MRKWEPVPKHPGLYTYKTKRGTRYGVRRGFKNSVGMRDEFTRSGFITWRQADKALKEFEATLVSGSTNPLTFRSITVDDYFKRMSKRKQLLGIWRESTRKNTSNYYMAYIRPIFGNTRLQEVTRAEYQRFLDSLATDQDLAKSTVHTIHGVMMSIFNAAEQEDFIDKNRLRGVEVNGKKAKPQSLEAEDFEKWFTTAKRILDKYELAMIYVANLGERRGELMGLRTTSIAFSDEGTAAVTFDLQRTAEFPNGGPLKTESSYRTIWVQGETVEWLRYAILTADNLRLRNSVTPDGKIIKPWLWVNDRGEPLHHTHVNRLMTRINKASGVRIHPHLLRHYFATTAISNRSPEIDVMHYLGHKSLQMTADYTRPTKAASLKVFGASGQLNNKKR